LTAGPLRALQIQRLDITYPVTFYGSDKVMAVAYDVPIPGYDTLNTNSLRLWSAMPTNDLDLAKFNDGDYNNALKARQSALEITQVFSPSNMSEMVCFAPANGAHGHVVQVLYPNDNNQAGKELRLKQQYFFVSATMQDMIKNFQAAKPGRSWEELPDKVAMQLNDTHPSIGVAELMRLLMDEHGIGWSLAWKLVCKVFAYTNHTVLPEALEKWSVDLMQNLLPRVSEIIFEINRRWLNEVREVYGDNYDKLSSLSIVEGDGDHKMFRMAHLAIVGSYKVNGVAAIHAEIVKSDVFPQFVDYYAKKGINDKFIGITNGVTCRRWLAQCNPSLNVLITKTLGSDKWIRDLSLLEGLKKHADNDKVLDELAASKMENKKRLAAYMKKAQGIDVDVNTMFDIQVKRIHEYKRQLLNVFRIIHQYDRIKKMSPGDRAKVQPRTCFIGGKAAAGYFVAKKIISLANAVSRVLEADQDTNKYLRLVVIENYKVSNAQVIIPANDISEHISTAGTEASGTSNMKFVMNGGLIIGTDDGANIEIKECVKEENIFIFGAKCHEIADATRRMREGAPWDHRLKEVFNMVRSGKFGNPADFEPVLNSIEDGRDRYLLAHDFASYLECQDRVDMEYQNKREWNKKCLNAVAGMGWFSTDRTIDEYAKIIWNCKPCPRPDPRS
jgi:starch phosphorylase